MHVHSHIAGFRWLFVFTSVKALCWCCSSCVRYLFSEVLAELFCCWPVCLLTNILVLVFSSLQLGVFDLPAKGEHKQWQHQMLCPALCFPVITSGVTIVIPILISLQRQNCSREGSILCLPRTSLGVSSSFQIILWMLFKWNSSLFSVQPVPVFSLDVEIMGIVSCLLC